MYMGLSDNREPDPDFDRVLDVELRSNLIKEQILAYVQEGVFSTRRIVRKLYDPDDPVFTKSVIISLVREVQQELISAYNNRNVLDDVLAFLEQNEEMIIRANELIDRCDRPRDRISAINAVGGLWKDRMSFLKDLGANFGNALDNGKPTSNGNRAVEAKRAKQLAALHEEADTIEAEFVEVEEPA